MTNHVYLVIDADRDVLDVCESQETADHFAKLCGGTVEQWPITRSRREQAWERALDLAKRLAHPN